MRICDVLFVPALALFGRSSLPSQRKLLLENLALASEFGLIKGHLGFDPTDD